MKTFRGIQGDGVYYYSYAVSIVWDKDLNLRNQFDQPLPGAGNQSVTKGNFFIDANTGQAFSLFNIGTGLLMVPALSVARSWDRLQGGRHPDPFSLYYQKAAGYPTVFFSALAILALFIILNRYFSFPLALAIPPLFLFGTNWLFYTTFFAGWAHAFSLSLCALALWSYLKLKEKKSYLYAALFGLLSGLLFSVRNFNLILFILLLGLLIIPAAFESLGPFPRSSETELKSSSPRNVFHFKLGRERRPAFFLGLRKSVCNLLPRKELLLGLFCLLFFLLGAWPQFYYYYQAHGSPFISSSQAASSAIKPFGFPEIENFKVLYSKNLFLLASTLFNSENGLFYFHPLYLIGLLGFIIFKHKEPRWQWLMWSLFIFVYIYWFLDAAYFDSWFCRAAGAGFGHRRFLDVLPFFVFGGAFILERFREKRLNLFLASGLISFLLTASVSLYFIFINRYADFYRQKDNLINLYYFLFKGIKNFILFITLWALVLIVLMSWRRENQADRAEKSKIVYQQPVVVGLIVVFLGLPFFIFRDDPEWDRQRFKEQRGFFLLYSLTPLVKLDGREWSLPEGTGRRLLKFETTIVLPAPLKKDDGVLLKISAPKKAEKKRLNLELYIDDHFAGSRIIEEGKHIYFFSVDKEPREGRKLRLKLRGTESRADRSSLPLFHEAKIIFKEDSQPPFGNVDLPAEKEVSASDKVEIEGWALDERGVSRVEIWGIIIEGDKEIIPLDPGREKKVLLIEAEFLESQRPDVENSYILYPDILRAGWRATVYRHHLPEKYRPRPILLRVVARDGEGKEAILGQRLVRWQNRIEK